MTHLSALPPWLSSATTSRLRLPPKEAPAELLTRVEVIERLVALWGTPLNQDGLRREQGVRARALGDYERCSGQGGGADNDHLAIAPTRRAPNRLQRRRISNEKQYFTDFFIR